MRTEPLKELWALAFGDSREFIDLFFSTAYAPERCLFLSQGDRVTSALYWMDGEFEGQKFAYIYGVATHPEHRGQGLCRKLMEEAHRLLAQQGYTGALLMPAEPELRQMYGKMGYRECSTLSEVNCTAGRPVDVRAVDTEEYARLRRQFLPEGGLIQEKENLRYLETYARFYAGEDFLLTAVHEKDRLFGMELLGNAGAAAGILGAMGYETGLFRIPRGEIPFAMGCLFAENGKMPSYLGLAFD